MLGPTAANPPRKHHYLPKFLSRRWTDAEGMLTRYAQVHRGRFEVKRVTPAGIGYQRDLYTIPGWSPEEAQLLETGLFSGVDHRAALALEEMIAGRWPLSNQARCDWARFLMAFWYRAPEDLAALKSGYETLVRGRNPEIEWEAEELERYVLKSLPGRVDNPRMGQFMIDMEWRVLDVSSAHKELLTCDQPVIRSNGFGPPDGNYSMAVSPHHLFIAAWAGAGLEDLCSWSASRLVARANRVSTRRARRFVLERGRRQRGFVERHFGAECIDTPMEGLHRRYQTGDLS